MKMRFKNWCFALGAFALAAGFSHPANAIYCANCGTEWTQLLNNFELVEQLRQQVTIAQQTLQQYQNMVTNTQGLDTQLWSNALGEIKKITALLKQAKSLSFASGNLDERFAKKYDDYKTYGAQTLDDDAFDAKYRQWSEDTNESVLATLKAAGLQSGQIEGAEDAYLRTLETRAETVEGRMQALQLGNQIALATARQMQKLRQLILINLQLQANYIQQRMDREAMEAAAWRKFTRHKDIDTTDGEKF
ncbi:MAG: P-type conjugative transfer protein TrbJ [Alphaproteobacteria bacterium]